MRLLLIHADRIAFEAKKEVKKVAEPLDKTGASASLEDALVAFTCVEKVDEANIGDVLDQAVASIKDHCAQVKTKRVAVYPYAHLSNSLGRPALASKAIAELQERLIADGFETIRAPFGWYKSFQLHAKGHPLAELSREIKPRGTAAPAGTPAGTATAATPAAGPAESAALKKEKGLKREFRILTADGTLHDPEDFDYSDHPDLKALFEHEMRGSRVAKSEPPHVRMMQEQELVDYEPGSDQGNFRWYPKGSLVKRLLEKRVSDIVADLGGMRVETPIMYDYQHPALSKYLNRFPARQYVVRSDDKDFFLRFAACFGQYLIAHDSTMSYKHLPVRLYELTHYSFRREQSGEVAGLRRLRAFTMPDMHTIVADIAQAKTEFMAQYKECMRFMADVGLEYYPAIRFVRSFYEENKDLAVQMVTMSGKPALVELWDERFFYFVMKFEFNVVDSQGKACALSTVQVDVENCERFEITYFKESGERTYPLILHASISGSVDRVVYALLEREARLMAEGSHKPQLPYWLAPAQVRLCPVSDAFVPDCVELAKALPARVDIDDREGTVGKKVRDAETEWVPLILVVGEREKTSGTFPVRVRNGTEQQLDRDGLVKLARTLQGDMPMERLPVPVMLSKRPIFRG